MKFLYYFKISSRTDKYLDLNGDLDGFLTPPKGFATKAIHVGQEPEQWKSMAVVPPICMSTTFKQYAPAKHSVSKETDLNRNLFQY